MSKFVKEELEVETLRADIDTLLMDVDRTDNSVDMVINIMRKIHGLKNTMFLLRNHNIHEKDKKELEKILGHIFVERERVFDYARQSGNKPIHPSSLYLMNYVESFGLLE